MSENVAINIKVHSLKALKLETSPTTVNKTVLTENTNKIKDCYIFMYL